MDLKKLVLILFLSIAAWQDYKVLSVKLWVYVIFGMAGLCIGLIQEPFQFLKSFPACMLPGALLLLMHRFSADAMGEGDGWFFVVSGMYLNWKENFYLLLFGLLLCSVWCVWFLLWGMVKGKDMKKYRIPFLPFLFPVGIWLVGV